MKIFVTGDSGFIGKAFVKLLLDEGHDVVGVSRSSDAPIEHINYRHYALDLARPETFAAIEFPNNCDTVVHLAWSASGGPDRENTTLQLQNLQNVDNVISELMPLIGAKRFVGVSTITEDEVDHVKFSTENPGPGYMYGLMKRAAYGLSSFKCAQKAYEHVWVKLGNTFGLNDPTYRFLNMLIDKSLKKEELKLSSCEQNYDFVWLNDAVRGLCLATTSGKSFEKYYVGSGSPKPLKEFVLVVKGLTDGEDDKFIFGEKGAVMLPLESFSIEKLRNETEYRAETSFVEGVTLLVEEMKQK